MKPTAPFLVALFVISIVAGAVIEHTVPVGRYVDSLLSRWKSSVSEPSFAKSPPPLYHLGPLVLTVPDGPTYYYIQATFELELDHPNTRQTITHHLDPIEQQLTDIFTAYPPSSLRTKEQHATVRATIQQHINQLLPHGKVHNIYATEWIINPANF